MPPRLLPAMSYPGLHPFRYDPNLDFPPPPRPFLFLPIFCALDPVLPPPNSAPSDGFSPPFLKWCFWPPLRSRNYSPLYTVFLLQPQAPARHMRVLWSKLASQQSSPFFLLLPCSFSDANSQWSFSLERHVDPCFSQFNSIFQSSLAAYPQLPPCHNVRSTLVPPSAFQILSVIPPLYVLLRFALPCLTLDRPEKFSTSITHPPLSPRFPIPPTKFLLLSSR